jgi:hypothetical protein
MVTLEDVLEVVEEVEPNDIDEDGSMICGHTIHLFIDKKRNPQWWIEDHPNYIEKYYRFKWVRRGGVKILNQTNFFKKEHLKHYLETVKIKHSLDNL